VLTERGLEPAVESLASRAPLPVEVEFDLSERLPGPVEAAAYFTVSEALTNVAKYAGATAARVELRTAGERLEIEVADDGVGGAVQEDGSGLRGLADRLAALGGELSVLSPPGEGTLLRAWIPLDQPEPGPLPAPPPVDRAARRRRWLQSHAVVYALVMALLVFIWLTTGAGYFWPQWPIAGWGLLLALHAWFAGGRHRGMLATETQPDR
jgi:hypothetical protein